MADTFEKEIKLIKELADCITNGNYDDTSIDDNVDSVLSKEEYNDIIAMVFNDPDYGNDYRVELVCGLCVEMVMRDSELHWEITKVYQ